MEVTGTLINYYFHCKRQCYLFGNRLNLEDNSEVVKIGKAIHENKAANSDHAEIAIENIKLDRLTSEFLTEIKKSDADIDAAKWQLIYYLKRLRDKGIERKGRLEFIENHKSSRVEIIELSLEIEDKLAQYIKEIEKLISSDHMPEATNKPQCKKCAYYEYCYV